MPSSGLRRTPSIHLVVSPTVAGSVRVICPPTNAANTTLDVEPSLPRTPRKRKINEISTTTPAERIAMAATVPSPTPQRSKRKPLASVTLTPLTIPTPTHLRPQSASTSITPAEYDAPPSPVPTEIIDLEPEDFVNTAAKAGVKIKDFAYEPTPASILNAPVTEYWDPVNSLIRHDIYIRRPESTLRENLLTGKDLYRLLHCGWVQKEEAERHWKPEDWAAMRNHEEQPYPYVIGYGRRRPTAAFRARLRKTAFSSRPTDLPDESVYVPPDVPGMCDDFKIPGGDTTDDEGGELDEKRRKMAQRSRSSGSSSAAAAVATVTDVLPTLSQPQPQASTSTASARTRTRTPAATPGASSAGVVARPVLTRAPPCKKRGLRRSNTLLQVR